MTPQTLILFLQLLRTILALLPASAAARTAFERRIGQLEQMVREGRDPTPEEEAAFAQALAGLRDELHS